MSLHEELGNLQPALLGTAIASVLGRISGEHNDIDGLIDRIHSDAPALSVLPDGVANTVRAIEPDIDEQRLANLRLGMTVMAAVLMEYANLEELHRQFPDAPTTV